MDKQFNIGMNYVNSNNYDKAIKAFEKGAHNGEKPCQILLVYTVQSLTEKDRYMILKNAFKFLDLSIDYNDFMNANAGKFGNHYDDNTSKIIDSLLKQKYNIKIGKFELLYNVEYKKFMLEMMKSQISFIKNNLLGKHL